MAAEEGGGMDAVVPVAVTRSVGHGEGGSSSRASGSGLEVVGDVLRAELLRGVPERRGMLKKLGGFCLGLEALKSVVDRWVEVRGPVVEYYTTIGEAQLPTRRAKGSYLLDADTVLMAPARHEKLESPYCFAITALAGGGNGFSSAAGGGSARVTEVFAAASEAEYAAWVASISAVLATLRRGQHHPRPPLSPGGLAAALGR